MCSEDTVGFAENATRDPLRARSSRLREGRIISESGGAGWGRVAWSQAGTVVEGTRLDRKNIRKVHADGLFSQTKHITLGR